MPSFIWRSIDGAAYRPGLRLLCIKGYRTANTNDSVLKAQQFTPPRGRLEIWRWASERTSYKPLSMKCRHPSGTNAAIGPSSPPKSWGRYCLSIREDEKGPTGRLRRDLR